jgi:hypothetical protein
MILIIEKEVNGWMDRWIFLGEALYYYRHQSSSVAGALSLCAVQSVVCVWYSVCIQRVAAINHNNNDNSTWLVNLGQAVVIMPLD